MTAYKMEDILLADLHIDLDNPRLPEGVTNQREAIKEIVADQKTKLVNMAEHIIENGTDPSDLVIVTPSKSEPKSYTVLEGNRRITVLKLLSNPELLDLIKDERIKEKLKSLSKTFDASSFSIIKCIAFTEREDANIWIQLKHTGENNGVGTANWNPKNQERFLHRRGITSVNSIPAQALEFLKAESDDDDIEEIVRDVPITNMNRLLGDPYVRKAIGVIVDDGMLKTDLPSDEVKKGLLKIAKDLADADGLKVSEIYSKQDRIRYINSFKKTDLPDKQKIADRTWAIGEYTKPVKSKKKKRKRENRKSTERKYLIPASCRIEFSSSKVNDIFVELKGLDVEDFGTIAGIAMRVMVELSLDEYIEKKNLKMNKKPTLKYKLEQVRNYLQKYKIMGVNGLRPINTALEKENSLLSPKTLHGYIHDPNLTPTPTDLKITWNNLQHFIEVLWEEIGKGSA